MVAVRGDEACRIDLYRARRLHFHRIDAIRGKLSPFEAFHAAAGHIKIWRFYLISYAAAPPKATSQVCGACSHEWIEHRISHKGKHANQPFCQGHWVRRRMLSGRCSGYIPYLLKPFPVTLLNFFGFCPFVLLPCSSIPLRRFPLHHSDLS